MIQPMGSLIDLKNNAQVSPAVHRITGVFSMLMSHNAVAVLRGGESAPELRGRAEFYEHPDGTLVVAHVWGLPETETGFFAFHVHEGGDCGGADFADTKGHWNPKGVAHPMHAGDLPPLLSADGSAYLAVLTTRFRVEDVLGRTVVIHMEPDDFHTQPAGNAGKKIACGIIKPA